MLLSYHLTPWLFAIGLALPPFIIAARRQDRRTLVAQVADDYVSRCRRGMGA